MKDIELPENGHEWSCTNDITNGTVPKHTKCYLHCQNGYDMISGKFYLFFLGFSFFDHYRESFSETKSMNIASKQFAIKTLHFRCITQCHLRKQNRDQIPISNVLTGLKWTETTESERSTKVNSPEIKTWTPQNEKKLDGPKEGN